MYGVNLFVSYSTLSGDTSKKSPNYCFTCGFCCCFCCKKDIVCPSGVCDLYKRIKKPLTLFQERPDQSFSMSLDKILTHVCYLANIWIVYIEDDPLDMLLNSIAMEFIVELDNEILPLFLKSKFKETELTSLIKFRRNVHSPRKLTKDEEKMIKDCFKCNNDSKISDSDDENGSNILLKFMENLKQFNLIFLLVYWPFIVESYCTEGSCKRKMARFFSKLYVAVFFCICKLLEKILLVVGLALVVTLPIFTLLLPIFYIVAAILMPVCKL